MVLVRFFILMIEKYFMHIKNGQNCHQVQFQFHFLILTKA